jgi:hypothetical protein
MVRTTGLSGIDQLTADTLELAKQIEVAGFCERDRIAERVLDRLLESEAFMKYLLANTEGRTHMAKCISMDAHAIADAMLAERGKKGGP